MPFAATTPGATADRSRVAAAPVRLRALRGLSGAIAAGLALLAVTLAVGHWLGSSAGVRGPGVGALIGHGVAAVAAVGVQLLADRSRGARSALASLVVLVIAALVLWFGWWR